MSCCDSSRAAINKNGDWRYAPIYLCGKGSLPQVDGICKDRVQTTILVEQWLQEWKDVSGHQSCYNRPRESSHYRIVCYHHLGFEDLCPSNVQHWLSSVGEVYTCVLYIWNCPLFPVLDVYFKDFISTFICINVNILHSNVCWQPYILLL